MKPSNPGREIAKHIEAIYVLEPWYSKMRKELEDTGWVRDNVFWERCKRTLDTLTKRVMPTLAERMAYHAFYLDGILPWSDFTDSVEKFFDAFLMGVGYSTRDSKKRLWLGRLPRTREKIVKDLNPGDNHLGVYGARIPLGKMHQRLLDNMYLDGKDWVVDSETSIWYMKTMEKYVRQVDRMRDDIDDFPYSFSAVGAVRKYTHGPGSGQANAGDLLYAKAIDRMSKAYYGTLPERILAINVALNTAHGGYAVYSNALDDIGVGYELMTKWSRMGELPPNRAKRYLENKSMEVKTAVNRLLEGQSLRAVTSQLVENEDLDSLKVIWRDYSQDLVTYWSQTKHGQNYGDKKAPGFKEKLAKHKNWLLSRGDILDHNLANTEKRARSVKGGKSILRKVVSGRNRLKKKMQSLTKEIAKLRGQSPRE